MQQQQQPVGEPQQQQQQDEPGTATGSPYRDSGASALLNDTAETVAVDRRWARRVHVAEEEEEEEATSGRWLVTVKGGCVEARDVGGRSRWKPPGRRRPPLGEEAAAGGSADVGGGGRQQMAFDDAGLRQSHETFTTIAPLTHDSSATSGVVDASALASSLQVELLMIEALIRFVGDGIDVGGVEESKSSRAREEATRALTPLGQSSPPVAAEDIDADLHALEGVVLDVLDFAVRISPPAERAD